MALQIKQIKWRVSRFGKRKNVFICSYELCNVLWFSLIKIHSMISTLKQCWFYKMKYTYLVKRVNFIPNVRYIKTVYISNHEIYTFRAPNVDFILTLFVPRLQLPQPYNNSIARVTLSRNCVRMDTQICLKI